MIMDRISNKSIANLLSQKMTVDAETSVWSKTFKQEIYLVGFVPYNDLNTLDFYKSQMNMNSDVIFTPYRVRLTDSEVTYPVMKKNKKGKGR